jgi:hypothetical protein
MESESDMSDTTPATAEKWHHVSQETLKKGYWSRLGNLSKTMDSLPQDVEAIYVEFEGRSSVRLSAESRLMYYADFTRAALGATTLHYKDVEALIQRKNPEIMIGTVDFLALITSKFHELSNGTNNKPENSEYIDFKLFAALIFDLFKHHEDMKRSTQGRWTFKDLIRQLPLDPDSGKKQAWDILCMILLLYCSFSVPFGIAFDTAEQEEPDQVKEVFEAIIDAMFLIDIGLNFITGWDNQGFIVREFSKIAQHYLRSWFIPDFAGSFPFDKVITALVDADRSTIASTTMLRGLRLIRMLKLIRAIKFMNKLEKLKQNEDFEAFGAAITLISATFFLFFTAHLLGCFYTILLSYEEGDNWLLSYNPDLASADASTRYTVSLYWAIVTIRCLEAEVIVRDRKKSIFVVGVHSARISFIIAV